MLMRVLCGLFPWHLTKYVHWNKLLVTKSGFVVSV